MNVKRCSAHPSVRVSTWIQTMLAFFAYITAFFINLYINQVLRKKLHIYIFFLCGLRSDTISQECHRRSYSQSGFSVRPPSHPPLSVIKRPGTLKVPDGELTNGFLPPPLVTPAHNRENSRLQRVASCCNGKSPTKTTINN